jgi:DNA mismatch repair protein MSH2
MADVNFSFSHASSCAPIPYVRPRVHTIGDGDLILRAARHPCVELQDGVSFIENDAAFIRGKLI